MGGSDDLLILHTCHLGIGTTIPVEVFVCLGLVQQTGKVDGLLFLCSMFCVHLDQLRVADNLLQTLHADLCEIFANLLCQEGEVVNDILCATLEVLT